MNNDFDDLYEGSRFQHRNKKRRLKLMIFSCITVIAILAVVLVSQSLTQETAKPVQEHSNSGESPQNDNGTVVPDEPEIEETPSTNDDNIEEEPVNNEDTTEEKQTEDNPGSLDEEQTTTEDPNVIEVIAGPWGPVDTVQEEPHVKSYEENSIDWEEQVQAIELATNLKQEDMIIWWLGNNGTNQSVATVTSNDQQIIYRVYLEWIEGEGWVANKAELLKENDRKPEEDEE